MTKPQERKPFIVWQSDNKTYRIVAVPALPTGNQLRSGAPESERWRHVLEASSTVDAMGQAIYEGADDLNTYRGALALLAQDYTKLVKDVMG